MRRREAQPLFFASRKADCLSEASFCLLAKSKGGVAYEVQRLIFSFGIFSFASRQKKSTFVQAKEKVHNQLQIKKEVQPPTEPEALSDDWNILAIYIKFCVWLKNWY